MDWLFFALLFDPLLLLDADDELDAPAELDFPEEVDTDAAPAFAIVSPLFSTYDGTITVRTFVILTFCKDKEISLA